MTDPSSDFAPQKRLFNIDEYHLMTQSGILEEKGHELIQGEILSTRRTGSKHAASVKGLIRLFNTINQEAYILGIQDPLHLGENNEPQPDVMILHFQADLYSSQHPQPKDVVLLIEVSDSTLEYDRNTKRDLYAQFGIPEYWVVNVDEKQVEQYQEPSGQTYKSLKIYEFGDSIRPNCLDISLPLTAIFL